MVTAPDDRTARVWDVPVGNHRDSLVLARLTEAMIGLRTSEFGALAPLERPDLEIDTLREEAAEPEARGLGWDLIRWRLGKPPDRGPLPRGTADDGR